MTSDLHHGSVTRLAELIRGGALSSYDLVTAHLARIERLNPSLNAVIEIADSAVAQALEADRATARGEVTGPLHGVPFTVKDVYAVSPETAQLRTAPGMPPRPDRPTADRDVAPARDSTAVARLRAAGAILVGVTKATLWTDREAHYGVTHNPYDLSCTPGGSSGGEATLVAAGVSPLGMGSDSGGSLRQPAHFCGVATIRPSNGRVPRATDADGMYDPRTVAGPLARTVADVGLALSIISGADWHDPTTLPVPLGDWRAVELASLRVAVHADNGLVPATAETVATVRRAADALADAGARLTEVVPPELDLAWDITLDYWRRCGGDGALRDYFGLLDRWQDYQRSAGAFMRAYDLILCPVEASPAPRRGGGADGNGGGGGDREQRVPEFTYTAPSSLLGWPAAVVRAGTSRGGLPIGVQLIAGPLRDDVALRAAAAVEAATGGWQPAAGMV
ncbi:amidase [Actinopolymorpha sp. B17G11]|uniref:amidase n=1 Tax=Actinopolymorpha sp. B17G11 TaxID=3160861 RepID=UPI0032E39A40